MAEEPLPVTRSLVIPASELEWRFTTSSGPGGQHANKAATRAEVRWDIEASEAVSEYQRSRLVEQFGAVVEVGAEDERSQSRNRAIARRRLAEKVADALRPLKPRRPTRPSRGAKERRLKVKKERSDVKATRRAPTPDD